MSGYSSTSGEPVESFSLPESAVLLHGPQIEDRLALQLALKELVILDVLSVATITRARRIGPAKRIHVLTRGRAFDQDVGRCLRAVLNVYERARPAEEEVELNVYLDTLKEKLAGSTGSRETWRAGKEAFRLQMDDLSRAQEVAGTDKVRGVPIADLAAAVFQRYRYKGSYSTRTFGFARQIVLPALRDRGLFTEERYRRLGLFDASRWLLTNDGTVARQEIAARVSPYGGDHHGRKPNDITGELHWRATRLGSADVVDPMFKAIDSGVKSGWDRMYGGD